MKQEIFNDDEFKAQPYDVQKDVANNYFDQELADEEFFSLPVPEQEEIKTNFMKANEIYDERIELANNIAIEQGTVQPEDGSATAQMPSLFENPVQKPNIIGDNLTENYRGNIDLDNRPLVDDGEGNYMTEHSITVTDDQGVHWIIPTIINGQKVSNDQAVQYAMQTGEHLGQYHNLGDAEKAAEQIHLRQQEHYKGQAKAIKAIKPYMDFINAADKKFNQDLEHYSKAPAEARIETAFEYFRDNIGEEYSKMDDEDRMAVMTAFFDQVVKPKEEELQYQSNFTNMLFKFADKALHTVTNNKDWDVKANARQYMQDQDRSIEGKITGFAGSAAPYVAAGFSTALIGNLSTALLTDTAIQTTLSVLEHARSSDNLENIALNLGMDAGINGLTFGVVRSFAKGNLSKGEYDKAAQQLFGKNADQLNETELAKFKEIEAKSKIEVAKEGQKLPEEKRKAIDEAAAMFDDMAAEAEKNAPAPDKTFSMMEGTVVKPAADIKEDPLYYEVINRGKNRSAKDTQYPNKRVMDRTVQEVHNGKEWENVVNKEIDVDNPDFGFQLTKQDAKSVLKGNMTPEIKAKILNDMELMRADPKWADDVAAIESEGARVFAMGGGNAAGGALGGGFAGAASGLYEENVEGKDLTLKDYLIRIAAGATGGAILGKKYGGKQGTAAFAGAKPEGKKFYSAAEKIISEKMPNKAPVSMVKGLLKEVKADEMKWSGIEKFLEGKESVTKADLLAAIKQPQLETKTLGSQKTTEELQREAREWFDIDQKVWDEMSYDQRMGYADEMVRDGRYGNESSKYQAYSTPNVGTNYREDLAILKDTEADKFEKELLKDQVNLRTFKDLAAKEDNRIVNDLFEIERKIDNILDDMVLKDGTAHSYDHAKELAKDDAAYLTLKGEKDALSKKLDEHRERTGKTVEKLLSSITERKVIKNKKADGTYKSGHWQDKNVLYHTRKQDVEIDGQKSLLVDEIQSDWHQEGRKQGYRQELKLDKDGLVEGHGLSVRKVPNTREGSTREKWAVFYGEEKVTPNLLSKEKAVDYFNSTGHKGSVNNESQKGVPQAPYAKNWHEKAMKDIIAEAVEKDYDRVAWVMGGDQAKRYQLSTMADEISVSRNYLEEGQYLILAKKSEGLTTKYTARAEQLPDYLGKDLAQKVVDDLSTSKSTMRYSGLDLELGGEGMKGFYDKMLPKFTNKYIKKYGSKVEIKMLGDGGEKLKIAEAFRDKLKKGIVDQKLGRALMDMPEARSNSTLVVDSPNSKFFAEALDEVIEDIKRNSKQVWSFEVTPKMKERVSREGQPLYAAPEAIGAMAGFEQDENGNWTYNIEKGLLGAVGAKLGTKALTSKQVKALLAAEFKRQGQKLTNKILDSVFSPVRSIVDDRNALPNNLDYDAVPADLIVKAASGDKEAFDQVAGAVFSRTFERIIGKNTGDQLKPMVLDKLMKNPNMVEEIAAKFGYKIRYFSSNPENVGRKIGNTIVEERPKTRQKLKKQGYESGNIWVYDPYDTHGAFNDPEYTKAWRGIHELSHAITERMMQAKYGDSRRFGALGNATKNPYDPTDPRVYKALTTEEAQRAIEWEDVAFRTQVELLNSMGIKVNKIEAVNDFNIAGTDTVIRTLTGDFSDPAKYGVLPRKDDYKISMKNVLKLMENQEKELARHQGRIPSRGIDLDKWKPVSDKEIKNVIKESLDSPLQQPKKLGDTNAQISIEAVAGEEVEEGLKEMVQSLPKKMQEKYHEEMYKALTDQAGSSVIAKKLGLEVGEYNKLAGVWKNETNPVAQIQVKKELDAAGNLTPEFKEKLDDMAEMYAVAFRQDGVGWHYPVYKTDNIADQNGVELYVGKALTDDQAKEVDNLLSRELGDGYAFVSTEKGGRIINMNDGLSNAEFHKAVDAALERSSLHTGDLKYFRAESNLVEGIKNGNSIKDYSLKRRPDLQDWFNDNIATQVERVNQRFESIAINEYGYKPSPRPKADKDNFLNPLTSLRFLAEDLPLGVLNGVDAAVRGIQKAILKGKTIDEAIAGLLKKESDNSIIDTIKKAVVQDYRLSDQYLELADKANIAIKRGEHEATKIFEKLRDLDEDELTSLHNFVAGESSEIPDHLKTLAASAKRAILAKTRELVSLGLLPEDILHIYRAGYLHREYEKHIGKAIADTFFNQQKKMAKSYKRGKEIRVSREEYNDLVSLGEVGDNIRDAKYVYDGEKNGKIILRRDWKPEERAEMGEITNAAYTVPSTIMKLQRDIAYGKFLAEVATDPKLKGVIKTAEEMKSVAGVSRVSDIPSRGTGYQLLSGSQYGKLDGMYVEDAVANDIKGFKESLYGDEKEIMEAWKTLLTEWKVAKTIKNPTAHMNNFLSNMVMSFYAGINPSKIGKNTAAAINEIRTKGAYYQEAEEIGLLGRSKLEEIRRVVDKPASQTRSAMSKFARNVYMSEDSKLGGFAYKMYSLEDDVSRLALYMHYRKSGMSRQSAMKKSAQVVFDYTKRMPPLLRGMRDSGLVPFVSWTYKAIPLMFSTLFQRPSRYAATVGAYVLLDGYLNDEKEKPEFMQGKYLTLKNSRGESTQIRTASMTPYFDWLTEPLETGKQLMLGGIPQKGVEALAGRQFWNDQKISYREGAEKAMDYGLWTFNNILPSPAYLSKVYNIGEAVANDGKQVKRNKLFKPRSTGEAAAGLFGFNVRTYNQREQDKRAREKRRKELK